MICLAKKNSANTNTTANAETVGSSNNLDPRNAVVPPAQPVKKTPIDPNEATPDEDAPEGVLYPKNDRAMESAITTFDFNALAFND